MADQTNTLDAQVRNASMSGPARLESGGTEHEKDSVTQPLTTTRAAMDDPPDEDASAAHGEVDLEANEEENAHSQLEQDLAEFVGEGQTKYELRQKARDTHNGFTSTWIDNDKTGLYDPAEERRLLRKRPKRPNPLLRSGFKPWDLNEESSDEACEPSAERPTKTLPKLEVRLKFQSEVAISKYREHVNALPAQAEPSEEIFSERRLRRRDSGVDFSHSLSARHTKKKHLLGDLPDDLTGHPIARGCWDCLTLGIRCPLLDDERAWPCAACLDDDNECELITPPRYKRPCEHCKGKRGGCSFSYTLDHDGPCEECARAQYRCVAGPAKEGIRERISYDRDWENDPWNEPKAPKPKKSTSCRRCRERGQPCSFSSGDKGEACTSCDMAGTECLRDSGTSQASRKRKRVTKTKDSNEAGGSKDDDELDDGASWGSDIFKSPQKKKAKTSGSKPMADDKHEGDFVRPKKPSATKSHSAQEPIVIGSSSESEDSSSEESELEIIPKKRRTNAAGNREGAKKPEGFLKTITTKFAHPIKFNHSDKASCSFCSDIRFAMFGLGDVEVEVVVWHDGRGLEEMGGGHRASGIDSTRMCVSCTTQRMPIVMCGKHEVQPLEGTNAAAKNNLALARLVNGRTTGQERWCSICPTLAQYECCKPGAYGKGCGLMLCEACMVSIVACDGSLEKAIAQLANAPSSEDRLLGLRADHEFLKQDGLLVKYVLWESRKA